MPILQSVPYIILIQEAVFFYFFSMPEIGQGVLETFSHIEQATVLLNITFQLYFAIVTVIFEATILLLLALKGY